MSTHDLVNSIEDLEFVAFKIVQAVLFFGGLWQVLNWHLRIRESLIKTVRFLAHTISQLSDDEQKVLKQKNNLTDSIPH